jgi:phosphorylcholine metabolism protein LicD
MENYILSSDDSYNLYKLLHRIVKILEKNNIIYWASGGTFLGAIRCKGIIKWDDDLDLCILFKDREKLKELIDNEKDIYLDLSSNLVNKIKYKTENYPFIDIFFMIPEILDGKTIYKCALKKARETWKNELYLGKELNPLKKIKFGAIEINIPNEYKRYFISNYGEKWNKEGLITYDHKNEKIIYPKIKWLLKDSDYEPAKPFYIEESFDSNKNRWWQF